MWNIELLFHNCNTIYFKILDFAFYFIIQFVSFHCSFLLFFYLVSRFILLFFILFCLIYFVIHLSVFPLLILCFIFIYLFCHSLSISFFHHSFYWLLFHVGLCGWSVAVGRAHSGRKNHIHSKYVLYVILSFVFYDDLIIFEIILSWYESMTTTEKRHLNLFKFWSNRIRASNRFALS